MRTVPAKVDDTLLFPEHPLDTLSPGRSTCPMCRAGQLQAFISSSGEAYLPSGCLWAAAPGLWGSGHGYP